MKKHSTTELVRQPIGYWAGEAYRLVSNAIRMNLRAHGLTQPQWWMLNHLAAPGVTWRRADLLERLAPYNDREQGLDLVTELDRLVARGLVVDRGTSGHLGMTEDGQRLLDEARRGSAAAHATVREGISDTEYARCLDTLRRVVENLGGEADLP